METVFVFPHMTFDVRGRAGRKKRGKRGERVERGLGTYDMSSPKPPRKHNTKEQIMNTHGLSMNNLWVIHG